MKSTLMIDDLSFTEELDYQAMSSVKGGFWFLGGCTFVKPLPMEEGEECNNGICVPYQDEQGNY